MKSVWRWFERYLMVLGVFAFIGTLLTILMFLIHLTMETSHHVLGGILLALFAAGIFTEMGRN